MRKKKILITSIFALGVLTTIGGAFAAYVIADDELEKFEISVDPGQINVNPQKATFCTYEGVSQNIGANGVDICDDIFSIKFKLNQQEYKKDSRNSTRSGIRVVATFSSQNLFDHVKDNVKNEFINVSCFSKDGTKKYELKMEDGKAYTSDNQNCLNFDNSGKTCTFHIPFEQSYTNNTNFYIQYFGVQDDELAKEDFVVGTPPVKVANKWLFYINFNFNIVDEYLGYSQDFNTSNFGSVNLKIALERFGG